MEKLKFIGSGKWGHVYRGCLNNVCRYKYARKNSKNTLDIEYRIMKIAHRIAPHGVVKPYYFSKHKDKNVLYLEYIEIDKRGKITMKNLKRLITKVIYTLQQIQMIYPSFRHNDLHWENVFNTKDNKTAVIGDFGFAFIDQPGVRNPIVTSKKYEKMWGIFPYNNENYDIHLLLNSIHNKGNAQVKKFIEKLIPKSYIGSENSQLINSRMRYNINHSNFPDMNKILSKY